MGVRTRILEMDDMKVSCPMNKNQAVMRAGATAEALDRIKPCPMQRDIVDVHSWITLKSIVRPQRFPSWEHHGAKKYPIISGSSPQILHVQILLSITIVIYYSSILSGKTLHPHGRGNRAPERSAPKRSRRWPMRGKFRPLSSEHERRCLSTSICHQGHQNRDDVDYLPS